MNAEPHDDHDAPPSLTPAQKLLDAATFWPYINIIASPVAIGIGQPWLAIAFSVAAFVFSVVGLGGFILMPMLIWSLAFIGFSIRMLVR